MSQSKKEKVIHVDKLIIHAKDVDIIQDQKDNEIPEQKEIRDPWSFFWGRPSPIQENDQETTLEENKSES